MRSQRRAPSTGLNFTIAIPEGYPGLTKSQPSRAELEDDIAPVVNLHDIHTPGLADGGPSPDGEGEDGNPTHETV